MPVGNQIEGTAGEYCYLRRSDARKVGVHKQVLEQGMTSHLLHALPTTISHLGETPASLNGRYSLSTALMLRLTLGVVST